MLKLMSILSGQRPIELDHLENLKNREGDLMGFLKVLELIEDNEGIFKITHKDELDANWLSWYKKKNQEGSFGTLISWYFGHPKSEYNNIFGDKKYRAKDAKEFLTKYMGSDAAWDSLKRIVAKEGEKHDMQNAGLLVAKLSAFPIKPTVVWREFIRQHPRRW